MPYCYNCGKEVTKNHKFCSNCGYAFNRVPKCFEIFGYVGFGLGIAAFVLSFLPLYGFVFDMMLSPYAIVFSCLAQKETKVLSKANKGLVFGILGLVISLVSFILFIVSMIILGSEY